jgi:hypothetical protein
MALPWRAFFFPPPSDEPLGPDQHQQMRQRVLDEADGPMWERICGHGGEGSLSDGASCLLCGAALCADGSSGKLTHEHWLARVVWAGCTADHKNNQINSL